MSSGNIVEIIGAVVDVEFPRDAVPKVYDALLVGDAGLTLEVQQQLGDGIVRTIAMGSSDGLKRGVAVSNTGAPISVPVGGETLGRIMDVLGNPIDERGPIGEQERASIHREAPTYEELAASEELLETGIKVIDLVMPIAKGGKVGLFGGAGVGKTVILQELIHAIATVLLPADKEMEAYITQMRSKTYDENIVESRAKDRFYNKSRLGKSFDDILSEKLAIADRTLYRRGNFMGTWDQVLCNALRHEYGADVSLSAGVRWGTTTPAGEWITMEDVMTQCSMTYGETYMNEMKGQDLMNVLEQVADNLFDPDPYLQSGGDMVRVGGLDFTIDPTKKLYERITDARLDNGEPIDPEKTYKVAGWAVVNRTPEGRLMWDVVRDYILKAKDPKDNVLRLPKINHPKLVGISDNPGIADYEGELG